MNNPISYEGTKKIFIGREGEPRSFEELREHVFVSPTGVVQTKREVVVKALNCGCFPNGKQIAICQSCGGYICAVHTRTCKGCSGILCSKCIINHEHDWYCPDCVPGIWNKIEKFFTR